MKRWLLSALSVPLVLAAAPVAHAQTTNWKIDPVRKVSIDMAGPNRPPAT